MSTGYTLTQREFSNLKRRLTRAINSKDPDKVIAECQHALSVFEDKGYPDDHFRWQRALDDAKLAKQRQGKNWIW